MPPTPGSWWRRSPDAAVTGAPETRFVVVDLAAPEIPPRVLAGPAATIWACVDGARNTAAITTAVAEAVGLGPDEVRADVERFLSTLQDSGLLVRSGPADPSGGQSPPPGGE